MGILTADMQRIINEQRLGFVASVDEDGTPNLSPKGTMVVLDEDHIAFGDIRSPNTIANVRRNPVIELNFVDPFTRKGYRFKGKARYLARATPEFDACVPRFALWGEALQRLLKGIVVLQVERAGALTSPAYDLGATEETLIAQYRGHYERLLAGR